MKLRATVLILALLQSTYAPASPNESVVVTKCDFLVAQRHRADDGTIVTESWSRTAYRAPDGRERVEDFGNAAPHRVRISLPATGLIYVLDTEFRTYRTEQGAHIEAVLHQSETTVTASKYIGTKTIRGLRDCRGYSTTKGKPSLQIWSCSDPRFPEWVNIERREADGSGSQVSLRNVTPNVTVSATVFAIPTDFKILPGTAQPPNPK
jgi:hypothetical protein